jgi:hypothetical protein
MSWLRLEGTGVSIDLTPGLEARVADPLWLLARQWQTGEFAGEDAASPVEIEATVAWHPIGEARIGSGAPVPVDGTLGVPLEARVESAPVNTGPARTRLAAEAALQLLRLACGPQVDPNLLGRLQLAYPLVVPNDDGLDPRGRLELRLLALRAFDGLALADALSRGAAPDPGIAKVIPDWVAAMRTFAVEPTAGVSAWDPERMEYSFAIAAPSFAAGIELESHAYPGGHLDWHTFDFAPKQDPGLADHAHSTRITTFPVPLDFPGMPAQRWWTFEDGAVYWGGIEGGPEELARYLVAAFVTVHGNDWFLVPVDLPLGVLAQVTSVRVRDGFGRTNVVQATAVLDHKQVGPNRRFRIFELSGDLAPSEGLAPRLLLPASLPTHEEGEPREEVLLLRDEVANLAWAVERVIESPAGRPASRAAERVVEPRPAVPTQSTWTYDLAGPIPPYFVPLVPVRLRGTEGIRLQRGRMSSAAGTIGARGLLLEPSRRLLLHEEEIPASGVRLTRGYQLCRGGDGRVYLWSGRRKSPGARLPVPALVHDIVGIPGKGD